MGRYAARPMDRFDEPSNCLQGSTLELNRADNSAFTYLLLLGLSRSTLGAVSYSWLPSGGHFLFLITALTFLT